MFDKELVTICKTLYAMCGRDREGLLMKLEQESGLYPETIMAALKIKGHVDQEGLVSRVSLFTLKKLLLKSLENSRSKNLLLEIPEATSVEQLSTKLIAYGEANTPSEVETWMKMLVADHLGM